MRDVSGLEDYCMSTEELVDTTKIIFKKWEEYEGILDTNATEIPLLAYQSPLTPRVGPGRPRFEISKEQLEYLHSLRFTWNEIAVLLGVSRMTIYRYMYISVMHH